MKWRKELDMEIAQHIDELLKKISLYPAFKKADKPANAQLWIALGLLSKKIYEQELKIKLLEQVLKDISPRKAEKFKSEDEIKKTREEVDRIMREIARGQPIASTTKVAKTLSIPRPPMSIVLPSVEKPKIKKKKAGKKRTEIEELRRKIKRNF
jgi:hypothetical protein